jgi:hypothetical protein
MTRIFVFTAGNPEARRHLEDSIKNPVRPKTVFETLILPASSASRRVFWRCALRPSSCGNDSATAHPLARSFVLSKPQDTPRKKDRP